MFLIPTQVRQSPIHGVGVYTAAFVPTGTVVWDFTPGVDWILTDQEMASIPEPFQSRIRRFSYRDDSGDFVLCGDNARFMNHSEQPNCDDKGSVTFAARDIRAGEELTCDYRSFDRDFSPEELLG